MSPLPAPMVNRKRPMRHFRLAPRAVRALSEQAEGMGLPGRATLLDLLIRKAAQGDVEGPGEDFWAWHDNLETAVMVGVSLSPVASELLKELCNRWPRGGKKSTRPGKSAGGLSEADAVEYLIWREITRTEENGL